MYALFFQLEEYLPPLVSWQATWTLNSLSIRSSSHQPAGVYDAMTEVTWGWWHSLSIPHSLVLFSTHSAFCRSPWTQRFGFFSIRLWSLVINQLTLHIK